MKGKQKYRKPVLAVERFVANEYVAGCDFKWKYEGSEVEGRDIHQGTYQLIWDYYNPINGDWNGEESRGRRF